MKKQLSNIKKPLTRNPAIKGFLLAITLTVLLTPTKLLAQSSGWSTDSTQIKNYIDSKMKKPAYPRAVGYVSFILPLVTVSNSTTFNFNSTNTAIGFPVGVNVLYSDHFGFSYEFTPTIKTTNGGATKVTDILFDPGTMFRFQHGFTLITRLAFDTNGRYGFTPVFNQVYLRTKAVNYFVALSLPGRFGAGEDASVGLNLQIGFIFN